MPFTDDELKRLKWNLENHAPNWFDKDNLSGLLSRLEAAERTLIAYMKSGEHTMTNDKLMKKLIAWQEAAGK